MTQELKIVMKCEDGKPLTSQNTMIYVNDKAIGCIQEIKLHVDAKNTLAQIDVTLPNLRSKAIYEEYYSKSNIIGNVDKAIELLSQFSNVKIIMRDVFEDNKEVGIVDEVGRDGV